MKKVSYGEMKEERPMKGLDELVFIGELVEDDRYFEEFTDEHTVMLKGYYLQQLAQGKMYTFPPVWEMSYTNEAYINARLPKEQPDGFNKREIERKHREFDAENGIETVNELFQYKIDKMVRIKRRYTMPVATKNSYEDLNRQINDETIALNSDTKNKLTTGEDIANLVNQIGEKPKGPSIGGLELNETEEIALAIFLGTYLTLMIGMYV